MRQKRRPSVRLVSQAPISEAEPASAVTQLRQDRLVHDSITGLPVHPFEDPERASFVERIEHIGVIYVQIGKFFGFEELHGWEQYDRILASVADGIREDAANSRFCDSLLSIRYSGSDGFYVILDLPTSSRRYSGALEEEAARFQVNATRRLRETFGGTTGDLMTVHVSSLTALDNPRARPSRHLIRTLAEAAKIVTQKQTREKIELYEQLKEIISDKKLRACFQPLCRLADGAVMGYEALIRGPQGSALERPNALFAVSHQNDMDVELESLCLETIFGKLPRAVAASRLFVNASATLLRHPIFLNARNLTAINKSHPDVVIEISEKEVVGDYSTFRNILDVLRGAGLKIAIDDAGSGYSGLESILQMRPEYIKIANSIVHSLHLETIKREIITALASLGRQIESSIVAEGIEHPDELRSLLKLGVNYGQGYLLGRPSPRVSH